MSAGYEVLSYALYKVMIFTFSSPSYKQAKQRDTFFQALLVAKIETNISPN